MTKFGIYVNRERDPQLKSAKSAAQALISRGKTVFFDETFKDELKDLGAEFVSHRDMLILSDLIVALGGDGTILKIIGDAAEHQTPVVGINLGHLGFLAQAERDDTEVFDKISNGDFTICPVMLLEARIIKNGKPSNPVIALNDIILRGKDARIISLEAEVDDTVAHRYLADGIIVSTSTGSTAYSLSCGGPIVHQSLDCMILTPVCPHSLKSRCIVVPPASRIVLNFDATYRSEVELKADGNTFGEIEPGDCIEIIKSEKRALLVNFDDHNYFDVIRKKLSD